MAILNPFQLLEINIISAQDLEVVSRKMKTYATARVNPSRKLTSSIDTEGHNNPTWNDKFVFRVRRPSGRPQGILNIGVALLDSSMRSMPLYSQLSASAVGVRDLMDDDHLQNNQPNQNGNNDDNNNGGKEKKNSPPVVKPILRRTKSERSERVTFENTSIANTSILAVAHKKGSPARDSSILSISDVGNPFMKKTTKASSVISGFELSDKAKRRKGKKGKSGSVLSDSVVSKDSTTSRMFIRNETVKPKEKEGKHEPKKEVPTPWPLHPAPVPLVPDPKPDNELSTNEVIDDKSFATSTEVVVEPPPPPPPPLVKTKSMKVVAKPGQKFIPYEFGASKANQKYVPKPPMKPSSSIWSDSEVGPSPSEVAANMAEKRYPLEDGQSSVLDGWSLDESVEGLRSKLDRWRTELPPIYDRGFSSSYQSSVPQPRTARRHSDGEPESGLFSCFGNFCGYECQCVCGKPPGKKTTSRFPSFGSRSFL
ncbi:hypothetical protein Leryth_022244 [Lithospermum erythrorhizon]|nr:hypothetical protein Leryth_022244 [Lithospermum erythrorhizon]